MNRLNSRGDWDDCDEKDNWNYGDGLRWSRELGCMAVNNGPGLGISPSYYECDPRQLSYRKQKENRTKRTS